jgi:hypothetical protein
MPASAENTSTGNSKATPNARNIRVVSANTSRIVHADWTNSLSKPVKKSNISGNTNE